MSKISKQKAFEAYPDTTTFRLDIEDKNKSKRKDYIKGYDQATQDIFNYLEANIPCGEISSEDVRSFIKECKEYFKEED